MSDPQVSDPMTPVLFKIQSVHKELSDTFTLKLTPEEGSDFVPFKPGQFNMIYQYGVGEVPVSISGDAADKGVLVHTIRTVGGVTNAMDRLSKGDTVGIRGPFGSSWPVEAAEGSDVVIVTGGIGLAPLRPAIYHILANRQKYGRFIILYGARTPKDILYRKELEKWSARLDTYVGATVDTAAEGWSGNVGVVTKLIKKANFDPRHTTAFVCGPEVMMRFSVQALNEAKVASSDIYVSMERNMKCAIGFCGRCQYGANFICKDGPVFRFSAIEDIFSIREI